MRHEVTFAVATPADAEELAAAMRPADREECALRHGLTAGEAARISLEVSDAAFAARVDGRLACLFGGTRRSLADADADAWMLCTGLPERLPRVFLAHCREGFRLLADALDGVETLVNAVHADNARAVRWLAWAGAWFAPSAENSRGHFGGEFRAFSIDAQDAGKDKESHV